MSAVRYHRYIGELWDDLDLEELVGGLSDFLLQSGFEMDQGEWDEDSLQALHDAVVRASRLKFWNTNPSRWLRMRAR